MARASRDGLTMTVYNLPNFIAQSIVKKNAKYSIRTLEPLANFAADPVVLFVSKDSPFNSVSDLVEFAKKNPGKVTLNGSGLFVGHHIALLLLAKEANVKLTYVPEKGGSDSLQSVMAGKVMGSFNNLSIAMRALDKIKVLGIADLQRHEFIPDVPTFIEQGYKTLDDATTNFRGYALPVGVDKAIVEKAALPEPIGTLLQHNLEQQVFSPLGNLATNVGDYVNQTILSVSINVLCFLLCFVVCFVVATIVVNLLRAVFRFPVLKHLDWLAGGVFGLLLGVVLCFAFFTVLPLLESVVPLTEFRELVDQSALAQVFENGNLIISIMNRRL